MSSGGGAIPPTHGRLDYNVLDTIAWAFYGTMVVSYHAWVVINIFNPMSSRLLVNFLLAQSPGWISKMVMLKGTEVTQVQTLRNTQIISTFVGTIAFTAALQSLNAITSTGAGDIDQEEVRLLVLAVTLFLSFLNFATCLRSANHLGYLLGAVTGRIVPDEEVGGGGGGAEKGLLEGTPPKAAPAGGDGGAGLGLGLAAAREKRREESLRSLYQSQGDLRTLMIPVQPTAAAAVAPPEYAAAVATGYTGLTSPLPSELIGLGLDQAPPFSPVARIPGLNLPPLAPPAGGGGGGQPIAMTMMPLQPTGGTTPLPIPTMQQQFPPYPTAAAPTTTAPALAPVSSALTLPAVSSAGTFTIGSANGSVGGGGAGGVAPVTMTSGIELMAPAPPSPPPQLAGAPAPAAPTVAAAPAVAPPHAFSPAAEVAAEVETPGAAEDLGTEAMLQYGLTSGATGGGAGQDVQLGLLQAEADRAFTDALLTRARSDASTLSGASPPRWTVGPLLARPPQQAQSQQAQGVAMRNLGAVPATLASTTMTASGGTLPSSGAAGRPQQQQQQPQQQMTTIVTSGIVHPPATVGQQAPQAEGGARPTTLPAVEALPQRQPPQPLTTAAAAQPSPHHAITSGGPGNNSNHHGRQSSQQQQLVRRAPASPASVASHPARPRHVRELIQHKITMPLKSLEAAAIADRSERLMRLMLLHFSLGFRALYISIPLAIYSAGPIAFIVATASIGLWLVYVDRSPLSGLG